MEQTELATQMEQAIQQFAVKRIYEAWRRWFLYFKLIHWHVPQRVAKFIANHWPPTWQP